MSEEINVDEVIRTIQFSEIAQKGYKVMSNDEFDRIVNGILNLQQENQQLKEELKDENNYHNEAVKWYKEAFEREQEIIKYKSVLDEIRDYLNKDYIPMDGDESAFKEDIAEILDKVKE